VVDVPARAAARQRMPGLRRVVPVLAGLLMLQSASAALFEDDEARRAILDLRARVTQGEEQQRARMAELTQTNAKLAEQVAVLQRSLLELNGQLEGLRGEIATLRGANEVAQRQLAELQKLQRDLGQAVDERMRRFEPVRVSLDGQEFSAEPEERKAYEDAVALLRGGDFDKAAPALAAFLRSYPGSGYANAARFWLGNAQYARRDYKEAIASFRAFVTAAPQHPRAPEALLALANSQAEMKDTKGARKTIEELVKSYPKSEAAQAGKDRLASLR
jgi:tol-pal system protein YbgF